MSVSRLIVGIVFLALGCVFFRGRHPIGAGVNPAGLGGGRAMRFVTVLAWIYTLVGLLWVVLAFA